MTKRKNYSTGAKWESIVGYSRAVRIGNIIEVSGTCAVDNEGNPFAQGDGYHQTVRILEIIKKSIAELGGTMEDVVRTRIFVTDITQWEEIGKAHGEVFSKIRPVTTMVEVSKLISPEYVVEIEATVILKE
ncbi:MAG: RidA family protein [Saprospiraceae bacterium]